MQATQMDLGPLKVHSSNGKTEQFVELNIADLKRTSNFSRVRYDEIAIQKLQYSIKAVGLLHNPGVFKNKDGTYQVAWGHQRTIALERLGYKTVVVKIVPNSEKMSDSDRAVYNFDENDKRVNPSAVDAAMTFLNMMNDGFNEKEIAYHFNTKVEKVTYLIDIVKSIKDEHLKALIRVDESRKEEQKALFTEGKLIALIKCKKRYGLTADQINDMCASIRNNPMDNKAISYVCKYIKNGLSVDDATRKFIDETEEHGFFTVQFRAKNKEYAKFRAKYKGMHPKEVFAKAIREHDRDEQAMEMLMDIKKLISPRSRSTSKK